MEKALELLRASFSKTKENKKIFEKLTKTFTLIIKMFFHFSKKKLDISKISFFTKLITHVSLLLKKIEICFFLKNESKSFEKKVFFFSF